MEWKTFLFVHLSIALVLAVCANGQSDSYLRDPVNVQNKEHIREHMSEYYKEGDVEDQLKLDSEEATQFHYFKLHDYDNNNKLDGLELYSAITDFSRHQAEHGSGSEGKAPVHMDEQEVISLVDKVLAQDDFNDDGFVDYYEFVRAQKMARENQNEV